jgi:uncharacterized protein YbjT (DUF2867 family)
MTLLVSGATGNVGSEVVRACAQAGMELRVGGGDPKALRRRFPEHAAVELDFLRQETWAPALEGTSALFLMRPPPIGDMKTTLIPFVDRALAKGCEHVVFLSVEGAERMSWVPHRAVEQHLERVTDKYTLLRAGFFAQNLKDAYRRDIVEDHRLFVPAGAAAVTFLDAADLGDVVAAVLRAPRTYARAALTLTGPEAVTFAEVAKILSAQVGFEVRYEPASAIGYLWHLTRVQRLPLAQAIVQLILHLGLRRGASSRVDPTLARVLGRPGRTLASYVARSASEWAPKGAGAER